MAATPNSPEQDPKDLVDSDEESESDASSGRSDEEIHEEAIAFFKTVEEAESETRRLALEDLEFSAGKQWPDNVRADRERDGRPCLVINRMPQFIQQITNDQRQNRPSIKVHPLDSQADIETAKIIQGLFRHIEYNSNAEVAYDTAFNSAVRGGFGFLRAITAYQDPMSFDQEILIKPIRNPFSVFFDPYSQEPDGSDAKRAGISDDLSPDEYKAQFPKSKLTEMLRVQGMDATGNAAPGWMTKDSIRIGEYFYIDFQEDTLVMVSGGGVNQTYLKSKMPELADGLKVIDERKTKIPVVRWCKLNGVEILEKTVWPGKWIPIVPVYGNEIYINGKRILEGIVRNAKDPQRMLNYWKSAETEAIALAPRAPFIIAEGQIEGYEDQWATANKRNNSTLTYKPTAVNGAAVPPPQRQYAEPAVQAITQASMQAADDLKATTGIYDPSLGAGPADTSGIAIQRRNMQAQTSNFHFVDNLSRSIKHMGRIIIDAAPHVYDTARAQRIIGDDGEQKVVQINQPTGEIGKDGKPLIYKLDTGQYDASVDVGPSFASKRQEAAASMLELSKASPQVMQVAADLIVKNMDWPGAQDIADRLRKALPPGLADDQKGQQPIPPQVQQQMQQMSQMIEKLTQGLHAAHDELDMKLPEIQSRERIEMAKIQANIEIKMAEMGSKESIALLTEQLGAIQHSHAIMADQLQSLAAPQEASGEPADDSQGQQPQPTGGQSPGSPMEGQ